MVPGVKILALKVNFGGLEEVNMLVSFLRCFPNVEILHIESAVAHGSTERHLAKFWREVRPVNCIKSHVKEVFIREFRGDQSEFEFIKFIGSSAEQLRALMVVLTKEKFASTDQTKELTHKLGAHTYKPWACDDAVLLALGPNPEDSVWKRSFRKASDLNVNDPFH